MAIKPTPNNNIFKSLIFDGVDSRDYGIYITGDAVFNSPERDVETIEIPGRNGAYALDKGRFSNIEVSYPAGIAGDTEADFRQGISAFRNALASRKGYKRLEDDYNHDEYRMAVYKSGLEVTPKALKAGEFTITFDCQPQRFLKSGENPRTIGGDVTNTQTESGSIVSIESDGGDKVISLVAQIEPVQTGSGDPSPSNVRPITGWTAVNVIVSPTTTASDGTTTTATLGRTVYGGTVDVVTGVLTVTHALLNLGVIPDGISIITSGDVSIFDIRNDSMSPAGAPNSILCSCYKTVNKAGFGLSNYECTRAGSSRHIYVRDTRYTTVDAFKSALAGQYVWYALATPQTYNLTAQQVELLTGQNHVWADTGDITLTYGDDPNKIVNPTLFESHPLLMTKGYGNITIGTDEIDINNDPYGRLLLANAKATSRDIDLDAGNMALMNTGDAITLSDGTTWRLVLTATAPPSIAGIASVTASVSGSLSGSVNAFAQGNTGYYDVTLNELSFQKDASVSETMTLSIGWTNNQGTTYSATVSYRCRFIANSKIQFVETSRSGVRSPYRLGQLGDVFRVADIYGDSTKTPLDETVYIDTDIGEAYTEAGGVVSSANALVSLPAKLPTLKSGVNTITYDDTITQFKIVPRWWEV